MQPGGLENAAIFGSGFGSVLVWQRHWFGSALVDLAGPKRAMCWDNKPLSGFGPFFGVWGPVSRGHWYISHILDRDLNKHANKHHSASD